MIEILTTERIFMPAHMLYLYIITTLFVGVCAGVWWYKNYLEKKEQSKLIEDYKKTKESN